MKSKRTILIIAALGVLLGYIGTQWRDWVFHHEEFLEQRALRQRWGRGVFTPISTLTNQPIPKVLRRITAANTNRWSRGTDPAELARMIGLMLRAFSRADWDAYRQFLFPVAPEKLGGLQPDRMKIIRRAYKKWKSSTGLAPEVPAGDEEAFIEWGRHLLETDPQSMCHSCWKSVNLEALSVRFVKVDQVPLPNVSSYARAYEPLRTTSTIPSIVAFPPPEKPKKRRKRHYIMAFVRIPIRMTTGKIGVYPIYYSFCWLPAYRKWLPLEIGLPTSEVKLRVWM